MSEQGRAAPVKVQLAPKGPLLVRGRIRLQMPGGAEERIEKVALCRCGLSTDAPLCNGKHKEIVFAGGDPVDRANAVPLREAEHLASGEVVVTPHKDGPLHLDGVIEINAVGDDGGGVFLGAWLCRCGQSDNKPFCDGSHKKVAFKGEGV